MKITKNNKNKMTNLKFDAIQKLKQNLKFDTIKK
jgi:hypothetical protein